MSLQDEIRFGTAKHTTLVQAIMERKRLSDERQFKKEDQYKDAENDTLAYVKESEADALRRQRKDDTGTPSYTTINIPYTYAMLLTAHTYWVNVQLARDPVFQYQGRHGEPEHQVQGVESVMQYQASVGGQIATLYNWMYDAPKYGHGVLGSYWADEKVTVAQTVEVPETYLGVPIPGRTRRERQTRAIPGYQGQRTFNIRPQDFISDPRVPLTQFQEGEFAGRYVEVGWNKLVKRGLSGEYFNLDVVKLKSQSTAGTSRHDTSSQLELPETTSVFTIPAKEVGVVDLIEMTIELIPKDWGLGKGEVPVKWIFTLAKETIIIGARPAGNYHDKFEYFVLPYEFESYGDIPRSLFEIGKPLNDTLNWLINSHFYNVRSVLNNQFIVDPLRVVLKDIQKGGAGKLIRLKEAAYGTDIRSVIQQLPIQDITRAHLQDSQLIVDMLQRVLGITDNVMGQVNPGGRKTATEVRSSNAFGINRLKTTLEYWNVVGFSPLAAVNLQNTQQYMSSARKYRLAGDLTPENGAQFMEVSPEGIAGFYDFVPVDGTLPVDRFAQANLWKEILGGLNQMPQVAQQYDIPGIFAWMSQLAGLKNIKQFKINVVPDDQLGNLVQQGNLVPTAGIGAQEPVSAVANIGRTS